MVGSMDNIENLDHVIPVQVLQGDGILWEGDLPSSLRVMTINELVQALRDRHLSEAASSNENRKQSSHTAYIPLSVQFLFNTMHPLGSQYETSCTMRLIAHAIGPVQARLPLVQLIDAGSRVNLGVWVSCKSISGKVGLLGIGAALRLIL